MYKSKIKDEYEEKNEYGFKLKKGFSLFKHQKESINWMINIEKNNKIKGGLLSLTMGLGKTLTTLSLCMSDEKITNPNLVVCSKTIAFEWKKDIDKFFGYNLCPYFYFHNDENDIETIEWEHIKDMKIVITTYETVMNIAKKYSLYDNQFIKNERDQIIGVVNSKKFNEKDLNEIQGGKLLFKINWNRIIADESHRFANPKSKTFYSMMCLFGDKKWCLSGTPLRNYTTDLYSQFRFCGLDDIINSKDFNIKEYNKRGLSDWILSKSYEDTDIVLPTVNEYTEYITLEDREKEIYEYYEDETKKIYNEFIIGSTNFSSVLTLFLRLRQICVAAYTVLDESARKQKSKSDDEKNEFNLSQIILDKMTKGLVSWIRDTDGTAGINSAKMLKMNSIISKIPKGEKVLVFTNFKKVIDIASLSLMKHNPEKKFLILDGDVTGKKRDIVLDTFRKDNYDVLFISYKVGSEGLNLTEANNVIMLENWWTPAVMEQAKYRTLRMGQKRNVNIYSIIIDKSIEKRIEEICEHKKKLIDDFMGEKTKDVNKSLDAAMIGVMLRR
jgi:SNF2 family DNA or RNA helicase